MTVIDYCCPNCGAKNPDIDEELYRRLRGMPLKYKRILCELTHPTFKDIRLRFDEGKRRGIDPENYCTACGKSFLRTLIIAGLDTEEC